MALFLNKERNSIVFNQVDFDINRNYIPDFFMALGQLDKKREIHIAIDLDETPVLFVIYFQKVLKESPAKIYLYYRDRSEPLRIALRNFDMSWLSIDKYPYQLPVGTKIDNIPEKE